MNDSDPLADSLLVHASFVQRLAHGLAGPDGDDLEQDTWSAALQHRGRGVRDVRAWLATIAANLWRNSARSTTRRMRRERAAEPDAAEPSVADIVAREESRRRVVDAVLALPGKLRSVVLLRYYEGLDAAAIARRHGVPHPTVRSQLRDALALLRERLDREHGARRAAWLAPLAASSPRRAPMPAAAVLRVVWPLRAALGVVAIVLLGILLVPHWTTPPAAPPDGVVPVARTDETSTAQPAAASERAAAAAAAAAATEPRGPEDLWGRVVAADGGRAIAGAEVSLVHHAYDEMSNPDVVARLGGPPITCATVRSGDGGAFAFRVQRALQHRLVVRADGFTAARVPACTGGSEVIVELERAAAIEGVVTRLDGTPVAGALVTAVEHSGRDDTVAARSASSGWFSLDDLPSGLYRVRARGSATTTVDVKAGARHRIELTVEPGRGVRGIVRDAATSLPIGSARIALDATSHDTIESAADGTFALAEVDERAVLRVEADGYVARAIEVRRSAGEPLDVALRRGTSIAGRIVDADGRPRADAIVLASRAQQLVHSPAPTLRARVDAAGCFRVDGVGSSRGTFATLLAFAPGCATRMVTLPAERLDASPLLDVGDVTLAAAGLLEGRVSDERGRAIAGASIRLEPVVPGLLQPLAQRATVTAADGMFRFTSLDAGDWSLEVTLGETMFPERSGPHAVVAGEIRRADVVVDMGLAINGSVRVRGTNEPVARHRLSLYATGATSMRQATVADDGTFRIERLAAGPYLLFAVDTPNGLALAPVGNVAAGSSGVVLELVAAETIEGRVVGRDGKPAADQRVAFWPPGITAAHTCATDRDGRFRIEVAPGSSGKVSVQPNPFQAVSAEVVAGTRDVELRLP